MASQAFSEAAFEGSAATTATERDRSDGSDEGVRPTAPKVVGLVDEHSFIRDCIQMGLSAVCDYGLRTWDDPGAFERDERRGACEIVITTCFGVDPAALAGTLSRLQACVPDVPVLVLGPAKAEPMNVAIAQGAKGYIPFTTRFDVVVEVIRVILAGGTYAPLDRPGRGGPAGERDAAADEPRTPTFRALTAREMAVVRAIRQGKSNKVIAYSLNMTESTVKVHVRHIMAKLKAKNRTEIAVLSDKMSLSLVDEHALN